VVVLTHGEAEAYAGAVADLLEGGIAAQDILIVHNLVTPQDREIAPPADGIEVVRLDGNPGYAVGMNTGIRRQLDRGVDWVWIVTHDVRFEPGAVAAMLRAAGAAAGYGALGPVLALRDGGGLFSRGGTRNRLGEVSHARAEFPSPPRADGIADAAWLDGSSILMRADALRVAGLYDESLYGYTEDADLCLRLERAGWGVGVVVDAVATQETGHSSRPGAVAYLLSRNNMRYRKQVAGTPGVLDGIRFELRNGIHYARVTLDPRSSKDARRVSVARLVGAWAGTAGYLAGRSGPPPSWLPGLGEMGRRRRRARRRRA
jgi:GT2 family glycosyltransferase